ncbi:MAG: protein MobC [Desulfovibrio sp.]|nr:protein MobC [Desulfovibrio sp.]
MNTQTQTTPQLTASRIKEIRQELAKMRPAKVTLDGNRVMPAKEIIFALAPALERMKKRGFDSQEIIEKLHERGIEIKPPTLAKYLNEFRRGKERKKDTAPPPVKTAPELAAAPKPDRPATVSAGGFAITPDIPLEEL